jgi:hypothetical protein
VELGLRLAEHVPAPVRIVNIGGGFGIPYFPGDAGLDLMPSAGAQVVLELGRFLVGEAGVYVCRVIDRKLSRGHTFLVTDRGLHHHLAASGDRLGGRCCVCPGFDLGNAGEAVERMRDLHANPGSAYGRESNRALD